jgi:metal-responsive CopG/Arc/MetJ family transcriptional regulator
MRKTITLPDSLALEIQRYTRSRNISQAIRQALENWVYEKKLLELRSRRGKGGFDFDPVEYRALEVRN